MGSRVAASAVTGVIAGIVFGAMMHMMMAPMPGGGQVPVIAMIGQIMLLGMPAFAPLMMPEMQMVAVGSLIGHLIYGLILGGLYVAFARGVRIET